MNCVLWKKRFPNVAEVPFLNKGNNLQRRQLLHKILSYRGGGLHDFTANTGVT